MPEGKLLSVTLMTHEPTPAKVANKMPVPQKVNTTLLYCQVAGCTSRDTHTKRHAIGENISLWPCQKETPR